MIHWCFAHPWIGLVIAAAFGIAGELVSRACERIHGG